MLHPKLQNLFFEKDVDRLLQGLMRERDKRVREVSAEQLASLPSDQVAEQLSEDLLLEPIVIDRDGITVDKFGEGDFLHVIVHVPYTGTIDLFSFHGRKRSLSPPTGVVFDTHVDAYIPVQGKDSSSINSDIDQYLSRFEQSLGWLNDKLVGHNERLVTGARSAIDARRAILDRDNTLVDGLSYRLRHRDSQSARAVVTLQRKAAGSVERSKLKSAKSADDPGFSISDQSYEEILSAIEAMVQVIEWSPFAFSEMNEESIRFMLLVPLNAMFEGEVSGETFNFRGKTDILLRKEGRNLFVAECKFWSGAKSFQNALKQLLSYTTWRDARTALIIFNRGGNPTAIFEHAPRPL